MTIRVFMVDDHTLVREGIAQIIDSEPDLAVTGQASSLAGGQALVAEGVPFRDAHEQVANEVRAGTFEAPPAGDRLGDVSAAVAAAKERWNF